MCRRCLVFSTADGAPLNRHVNNKMSERRTVYSRSNFDGNCEETGPETQLKDTTQEAKRRSARLGTYVISAALLVIFIVVIGFGFISRRKAEADLKQSTAAAAIPSVNVVYPKTGRSYQ